MIQRASQRFVIEGPVVPEPPEDGPLPGPGETVRCRIEIDRQSGLIDAVSRAGEESGELSAAADVDLLLDDDHIIFPGFVDAHVHAREDPTGRESYKEDFASAGRAALRGGVTLIADMPNNPVPPADDRSYLRKRERTAACGVDVLLHAIVGAHTRPLSFSVPYKCYMGPSVGEWFFDDEASLREALPRYRGCRVSFHAELPEILRRCADAPTHAERRPPEAEVEAIDLALRLCENYGIDCHICHLSTAEGLARIRAARARGQDVTCEVTPHHLYWDEDNVSTFPRPGFLQCNPPIRTRLDRVALLDGLRTGDIDFLATDHAPHTVEEKERGTSGVTHLDTYGHFVFWLLEQGLSYQDVRRVASENPGRFASAYLPRLYGRITPGFAASITVLRRGAVTVRREELATKAGWSCFEGRSFDGRAAHTVIRGRLETVA